MQVAAYADNSLRRAIPVVVRRQIRIDRYSRLSINFMYSGANFTLAHDLRSRSTLRKQRSDSVRTLTTLAATTGTFAVRDYANRGARSRPRPASQLYRMKLSTTRLASLILARFARALVAADMPPALVVKARVGEVVSMLRRGVSKQALRRYAERKLWPRFDLRRMTQQALGDAWHDAGRQQQRSLENGLRDSLLDSYAALLSAASNSRLQFEVKPVRHSGADEVTVKVLITRTALPAMAIEFRMENQRNGWQVYDVLIDGVSVTAAYRESLLEVQRRRADCGPIDAPTAAHRGPATRRDSHIGTYA